MQRQHENALQLKTFKKVMLLWVKDYLSRNKNPWLKELQHCLNRNCEFRLSTFISEVLNPVCCRNSLWSGRAFSPHARFLGLGTTGHHRHLRGKLNWKMVTLIYSCGSLPGGFCSVVYQFLFQEETKQLIHHSWTWLESQNLWACWGGLLSRNKSVVSEMNILWALAQISKDVFCLGETCNFLWKISQPKPSTFTQGHLAFWEVVSLFNRRIYGIKSPVLSEEFFILRTHAELSSSLPHKYHLKLCCPVEWPQAPEIGWSEMRYAGNVQYIPDFCGLVPKDVKYLINNFLHQLLVNGNIIY